MHQALRAEFPPLRSLDATPNNLPVQLTSFVGRESELAELARLANGNRLLTLTGSGGVGRPGSRRDWPPRSRASIRTEPGGWSCPR